MKEKKKELKNQKIKKSWKNRKNPFIDFSEIIDDVYVNLEDYNLVKKRKVLMVYYYMIADVEANKKISPIVTDLLLSWRKFNISFVFISQSCFKVLKTIRLNASHIFIMKISSKTELRQIAPNHLSNICFKDFMNLYKD